MKSLIFNKNKRNELTSNKKSVLIYTGIFICIFGTIFLVLKLFQKSTIGYTGDGFIQHFSVWTYLKSFYLDLISNILSLKNIKMIDLSIGSGFDILTTLNYYGYGDPFSFIMLLFENEVIAYDFANITRLYVSGLCMMYFIDKKYENVSVTYLVITGVVYALSGFAIYAFMTHSYFNNALLFLPLILAGIEIYEKRKSKKVLIISVTCSWICNFYFAYMNTIFAIFYVLFQLFYSIIFEKKNFREEFTNKIKLGLVYLAGILLASVVLFPIIYAFLNNARTITEEVGYAGSLLLYPLEYYKDLFVGLVFTPYDSNMWSVLGIGGFSFIALILLFKSKQFNKYKIIVILCVIAYLIPMFGKILNGFSYVTNRWSFVFSFIYTIILLKMIPNIININKKDIIHISIIYAIYLILSIFLISTTELFSRKTIIYILMNVGIFVYTIISLILISIVKKRWGTSLAEYIFMFLLTSILVFTLIVMIYARIETLANSNVTENIEIREESKNEPYRVAREGSRMPNYSLLNKEYTNTYYYSLIDKNIVEFYNSLGVSELRLRHRLNGLDHRVPLLALSSTKYYIGNEKSNVPYGFYQYKKEQDTIFYENKNNLPLGYIFDSYIEKEKFDTLSVIQKEQTLTQTVVIENKQDININIPEMTISNLQFLDKEKQVELYDSKGKIEENKICFDKNQEKIELKFEGEEFSQNYLVIKNPVWKSENEAVEICIQIGDIKKFFYMRSAENNFYFERENIVINLGYFEEKISECCITAELEGDLSFESINILTFSPEIYDIQIKKLQDKVLENVEVSVNTIKGKIKIEKDGILQISVPYSIGWKCFVNEKEVDVLKTDIMYMGVQLEKGEYNIKFVYETPYLRLGLIVSCVTFLTLVFIHLCTRNKNKINTK